MHVVLLLGSSTAGKSTLCRQLVAEHRWSSGSMDDVFDKIVAEKMEMVKLFLSKQDLFTKLQSLMTEEEVQRLAVTGCLNISKGQHPLSCQFDSPAFERLEGLLNQAGFTESEIPELARLFRAVNKIGDDVDTANPLPDPLTRLYDETFIKSNFGKSIVLDVVPNQADNAQTLVEAFEARAKQYREKNPGEALTTSVVIAYCPPQTLSERIQERNRKAEKDNPSDKREGLGPLEQLATLVTADKEVNHLGGTLSRDEIFYMINRHATTDKVGDSLFLENPVDFEALQDISDENSQLTTTETGVVKLLPQVDEQPVASSDKPRIGSAKTIQEYKELANRFGFTEEQERTSLNIREGIHFDAVINTVKGTPAELADMFLQKLAESKKAVKPEPTIERSSTSKMMALGIAGKESLPQQAPVSKNTSTSPVQEKTSADSDYDLSDTLPRSPKM